MRPKNYLHIHIHKTGELDFHHFVYKRCKLENRLNQFYGQIYLLAIAYEETEIERILKEYLMHTSTQL